MQTVQQRQFLSEFIQLYRSLPCLWDATSKEYVDRAKKSHAYDVLLKKYKAIDEGATRATVARKINSLRTCYRREQAKVSRLRKLNESYKPHLWYFDLFTFLDQPRYLQAKSTDNDCDVGSVPVTETINGRVEQVEIESVDDYVQIDSDDSTACEERFHFPCGTSSSTVVLPSGRSSSNPDDSFRSEDSLDVYGKHLVHKLRSFGKQQRRLAQKLINDTLFEAEMETLCPASKIVKIDEDADIVYTIVESNHEA